MRVVDAWMQPATSKFLSHEMTASVRRWIGLTSVPENIDLSVTTSDFQDAKVTIAMASAWHTPEGALISNEEVYELTKRHPDQFLGIASVDIRRPMEAVRELRRCVKSYKFRGLRVLPWVWETPPTDRRFYPLFAECIELGVPFCTQVGHTGPLRPSEPGRPIPYLDQVAIDFPDLVIVAGHIGFPWTNEMIALATKYPNVYIDTSAYKPSRYPAELVSFLNGHGRKKVMFGTNYPMIKPKEALEDLKNLKLSEDIEKLFLYENAAKAFGGL